MKIMSLPVALLALSGAAQAGITVKTEDANGEVSVISIDGNRLRVDGDKHLLIYDGEKKELITADPKKQVYSKANQNDMKQMGAEYRKRMDASLAEMRKQMANMPPEQRKKMEAVQKQMEQSVASNAGGKSAGSAKAPAPVAVKYESLGEKKQVAGHSCNVYRVVRGESAETACFIPWSEGAIKKDELKVFDSLAEFMSAMTESMGGSRGEARSEWTRQMLEAPGMPVLMMDASGKTTMQVKSIERGAIAADKFGPPAGYTKGSKGMFGE